MRSEKRAGNSSNGPAALEWFNEAGTSLLYEKKVLLIPEGLNAIL